MSELQTHIPQFEAPEPSRMQALSMRAAGVLLRAESRTPEGTMQALVTKVGGYNEVSGVSDFGQVDQPATFTHDSAKKVATTAAQDETTKQGHVMSYKNSGDFTDDKGTYLSGAVSRTVNKNRASGRMATKVRGKIARRLVNHAVKGVGVEAHRQK